MRMKAVTTAVIGVAILWETSQHKRCHALAPPSRRLFGESSFSDEGGGGPNNGAVALLLNFGSCSSSDDDEGVGYEESSLTRHRLDLRGGGSARAATMSNLSTQLPSIIRNRFSKQSKDRDTAKRQEELLSSTKVKSVSAPGSAIPQAFITQCAEECGLIGGTLTPEKLEHASSVINRWYLRNGFALNCVIGATLVPSEAEGSDDGTVVLKVREVKLAKSSTKPNYTPLKLTFIDKVQGDDGGSSSLEDLLSIQEEDGSESVYARSQGRTSPNKLARMLRMDPGSPLQLNPTLISELAAFPKDKRTQPALFSKIHAVRPVPTSKTDEVEVEMVVSENKPYTSFEYGITKSLYTNEWEGELNAKNTNAFGGGEVVTVNICKGRSNLGGDGEQNMRGLMNGQSTWRISLRDDYLGDDSGYELDLFQGNIDEGLSCRPIRTGSSMKVKVPRSLGERLMLPVRTISSRFEHIQETDQRGAQCIASVDTELGQFESAWGSVRSSTSVVAKLGGKMDIGMEESRLEPYASCCAVNEQSTHLGKSRGMHLSLRNVVSTSSRHIPSHEAYHIGLSSRVRGYGYNAKRNRNHSRPKNPVAMLRNTLEACQGELIHPPRSLSSAVSGSLELRVPFDCLSQAAARIIGDGSIVVFGDWCFASPTNTNASRYSSVGVGARKSLIGIPLKIDACLTEHGTKGVFFGLGQ